MSGCGTSGRLGFITAVSSNPYIMFDIFLHFTPPPCSPLLFQRSFNQLFPGKFHYTIAGGDRALLLSTEAPEDSWTDGVRDLEKVMAFKIPFIALHF